MAPKESPAPQVVVVIGVSGSGKSTVGKGIARAMGWVYAEGDDFHPASNVAKMSSGHALSDQDRWPWLRAIGAWMDQRIDGGRSAVVACSALKRSYRDLLREGRPDVRFCEIDAPADVIAERLSGRTGHFMPPSLLPSQLATLEPLGQDEPGVHVEALDGPDEVVRRAIAKLGLVTQAPAP